MKHWYSDGIVISVVFAKFTFKSLNLPWLTQPTLQGGCKATDLLLKEEKDKNVIFKKIANGTAWIELLYATEAAVLGKFVFWYSKTRKVLFKHLQE